MTYLQNSVDKSLPNTHEISIDKFLQMQLNLHIVWRKCECLYVQNWDVECFFFYHVAVRVAWVFVQVKFEQK